jgi:hypothetical protein
MFFFSHATCPHPGIPQPVWRILAAALNLDDVFVRESQNSILSFESYPAEVKEAILSALAHKWPAVTVYSFGRQYFVIATKRTHREMYLPNEIGEEMGQQIVDKALAVLRLSPIRFLWQQESGWMGFTVLPGMGLLLLFMGLSLSRLGQSLPEPTLIGTGIGLLGLCTALFAPVTTWWQRKKLREALRFYDFSAPKRLVFNPSSRLVPRD